MAALQDITHEHVRSDEVLHNRFVAAEMPTPTGLS
jgi:hypothetical protein